ncbi:hypothetical protein KP509_36G003900 [Ceratopteris richardii]|uniref:Uncharacterized protein n=1 Tax=Ceratopteris richardii TaxID=49495 RepID=A0A8T2Q916_CERRI|nr:hypothetical protein KP509_36G003900 [Ceratopteris richardii]
MRYLVELGIGLSVVFGIFVLVLLAELCYIFCWKKGGVSSAKGAVSSHDCLRSAQEIHLKAAGSKKSFSQQAVSSAEFAHEASLVGSFGGYLIPSSAPFQQQQSLEVRSGSVEHGGSNYSQYGFFDARDPHSLFSIKEETKEDMELAAAASTPSNKPTSCLRSRTPSDALTVHFTSASSSPVISAGTPFTTPPSSPPLAQHTTPAKLSPYAACAVWPMSVSARASSSNSAVGRAELPNHIAGVPADQQVVSRPPTVGAAGRDGVGRTSLRLLFERSPLVGPSARHSPSPSLQELPPVHITTEPDSSSFAIEPDNSSIAAMPGTPLARASQRRLSWAALFERVPLPSPSSSCPPQ